MSGYRIGTWPDGRPVNIDVPDALVDKIKADAREEAAAKVRKAVEQSTAYRPKWEAGMQDAAKLIEEG